MHPFISRPLPVLVAALAALSTAALAQTPATDGPTKPLRSIPYV